MRVFLRVYPIVFVLLISLGGKVWSQDLNPTAIEAKILQGSSFEFDFISSKPIKIASEANIGSGLSSTEEIQFNLDYKFIYESDPNFIGASKFIIERTSINNRTLKVYTEINVIVVPSLIEAIRDVAIISEGATEVEIDVLSNDIQGNGSSFILDIDLVKDGSAQIIDNKIVFTKAYGFYGQTSFNYTIEDASGYKSSGIVVVNALDNEKLAGSTVYYMTSSTSAIDIIVDDPSYELDPDAIINLGSIEKEGDYVLVYTPNLTDKGIEIFDLTNALGDVITVVVEIIDNTDPGLMIKDDVYYTSMGSVLIFDPRENDYSQDGSVISYSEDLFYDGTYFTYVPELGFSGVKNYTYTVVDGQKEITGSIEIYIGNYLPQLDSYTFETFENAEFVFAYNAPIKDYLWSIIEEPYDGTLSVNVGSRSSACAQAIGYHMVVYTPDQNFTGVDEFTLEYCVSNGTCKTVEITINVLPSNENCHCFGSDCVWAGDADNDGKVAVQDILSIGYNYGEIGSERPAASEQWRASFAANWPFEQEETAINNKYADANGDGIINSDDAEVLNQNLSLYHSINAQEVIAQKDVPLSFIGPENALAGDLVVFEVFIGSEDIPAVDLRGIAFGVQFPTDKFDPESIKFTPDDKWIGNGSPVLTATNIDKGLFELGMARTGNIGAFGNGKIGEISLTIREDIDGTITGDSDIPISLSVKEAIINNSVNKKFQIQPRALQLKIISEKMIESDEPEVVIFPNPTHDQLSIHANNQDILKEVKIYNLMGGLVLQYRQIQQRNLNISHNLPQGIYTASITTEKGMTVQKIQVIQN